MATLAPPDSPSSSSRSFRRQSRSFTRRCERVCCSIASCFPLAFVYSVTTWAVWVESRLGLIPTEKAMTGVWTSILGISLYILLNSSYTIAVFTNPGSPIDGPNGTKSSKNGYSHLPTTEPRAHFDPSITSITVSSTGEPRYCKKCMAPKPDRAHHCSTCRRCVLKMDHHCPWLATCVGLRNYKPFLLFLIYTSLFCWVCLATTGHWLWAEVLSDEQYLETLMPINVIMLAIISGIIGLVLTGFTIWHITLAWRGMTTIECLEKTRYLSPLRKAYQQQLNRQQQHHPSEDDEHGDYHNDIPGMLSDTLHKAGEQILSMSANTVPGATRLEEGEEEDQSLYPQHQHYPSDPSSDTSFHSQSSSSADTTPAQDSLSRHRQYRSPASREASLDRRRYQDYLDDEYAPKMPHAFNLGWRKNLNHLFGPSPLLWWLPICNTTGDGWRWEVSPKWFEARDELAEERRREAERVGIQDILYEGDRNYHGSSTYYNSNSGGAGDNGSSLGSPLSLHTLNLKRKSSHRRDFDRTESGEVDSFQVSGSSDDGDEERDAYGHMSGGAAGNAAATGRLHHDDSQDNDEANDEDDGGWKRW